MAVWCRVSGVGCPVSGVGCRVSGVGVGVGVGCPVSEGGISGKSEDRRPKTEAGRPMSED
ncbi:MAG: hypothetical protein IPL46_35330 [Saprospiraceae bacterium]|nr:hypothetical protein [Saprospiraceae bacterium]